LGSRRDGLSPRATLATQSADPSNPKTSAPVLPAGDLRGLWARRNARRN
jgi:hypothetical protein